MAQQSDYGFILEGNIFSEETDTAEITETNINDEPMGSITISGTPIQYQELTAATPR